MPWYIEDEDERANNDFLDWCRRQVLKTNENPDSFQPLLSRNVDKPDTSAGAE